MSRALQLLFLALVVRLPALLSPHFYSGDEATYSALATSILHGATPYVGAVDHKPPGIELTYAALYGVFGEQALWAPRLALALACWGTSLVLAEICRRLCTGGASVARRIGGCAAIAYLFASTFGLASDTQAANTELFLNLPLSLAALCALHSIESPRLSTAVEAGVLVGIAGLYKYQAALVGGAFAVTASLALRHRRRQVLTVCVGLSSGFMAVATSYVGYFACTGHLDALAYWGWKFNFVYMSVLTPGKTASNALEYTAMTLALWSALLVAIARRPVGAGGRALPVAWLVAALVAVSAGGRFFPHYYLMALPGVVVLSAPGIEALVVSRSSARNFMYGLGVACAVLSFGCACVWYRAKPGLRENTERYISIGAYVRDHSTANDRVFVWGNSPEIYFFARRAMGTRFPFCNYHTGLIWGSPFYDDGAPGAEAHVVERAWVELAQDLTERPPLYVVDAAAAELDHFGGHEAIRYPRLASLLSASYELAASIDGARIYRRRESSAQW